jgi:pimeloyl-ACP methyl ester carboxylesterase
VKQDLASDFELFVIDRRGRGSSTDEAPGTYDIGREGEDVAAVIATSGQPTWLVGHSYGALVALEAATRSPSIAGLVLYEPASASPGHVPVANDVLDAFEAALAGGDRARALVLFFEQVVGLPAAAIDAMRGTPIWQARMAAIHTALREGRVANDFRLDQDRFRSIDVPAVVLVGTESPAWLRSAAAQAVDVLPRARLVELDGQGHMAIDQAPDLFSAEVRSAARC